MGSPFFTASSYLKHRRHAVGAHGIHSPFVYELYQQVIKGKGKSIDPIIEEERRRLVRSRASISYRDFKTGESKNIRLSYIARTSPSHKSFSAFLQRLCDFLKIERVLETGTSLGINALYLAKAQSVQHVGTLEGNESVSKIAKELLSRHTTKVTIANGDLYELFPQELAQLKPQLVFLDADHRSTAISFCLEHLSDYLDTVQCIVIHDIYWSRDMAGKWREITEDPTFPLTIDLFHAGLVFPHSPMEKQHFRLKF